MTAATAVVPADYDELARLYGGDIRAAVRRCLPWAKPYDREDVVQYILAQFIKRDVIALYTPGYLSDRPGHRGEAVTFRSFLLGQVPVYCRGKSEALARTYGRELCIADVSVGDGHGTWLEGVTDPATGGWDQYPSLGLGGMLEHLRSHLAERPAAPGQPALVELFDDLADRMAEGKPVTEAGIRRRFRMDEPTAAARLAELRRELRTAVARHPGEAVYDVGGMSLTAEMVRSAAGLLRAAPGNQVVKVWERAGHPLAELGRDWYVPWAKQELSWYPHLRGAKGGHFEGGHGRNAVKNGLIHRLERLLAGEEPPALLPLPEPPEPEESWLDRLEAALWQVPEATPGQVDEMLAAARKVFGA